MHHNYKLLIAYDGTQYSGWQIQPNGLSIQELIETELSRILQLPAKIVGSGRTDAGVHALGQVAHCLLPLQFDCQRVKHSLNSLLPPDIRILSLEEGQPDFHAQYSALGKIYRYHLFLDPVLNPFRRLYCWHIRTPFDLERLQKATSYFLGTHDFTSFANEAHRGVAAHDPVRNIKRIDIVEEEGGIYLEFEADGFLYKMVRNMVGTLVEVALGKLDPHCIPHLLQAKDRTQVGLAAPPQGLFLTRVIYPDLKAPQSF